MPELSHETADDGFHQIQLTGKQLVFLFIVSTTVVVAVFLCGVLVGRGARPGNGAEPETAMAAAPHTQPAEAPVAAAEPPAPTGETPDELSYHKRLQEQGTATESLKRPTEQREPVPPAKPRSRPVSRVSEKSSGDVPVGGRPGTWVVQVIATPDRAVATAVVTRLAGKGYPAFLLNPAPGDAQRFYKVRIGRFNDRREAEQVSQRIKKEEQFQPWISR